MHPTLEHELRATLRMLHAELDRAGAAALPADGDAAARASADLTLRVEKLDAVLVAAAGVAGEDDAAPPLPQSRAGSPPPAR